MKVISNSALRVFAALHPQADEPLRGSRRVIEKNRFGNWTELKAAFSKIDKVGDLAVFDIGGNKYRLIAYIRFEKQIVYIKAVLTHRDYDKGMEIMNARIQVKHLLPAWEAFRSATNIAPIRDAEHYQRMVSMLEALLDEAGGNESHPAMGLVDIVGDLIEDYETENHPLPDVTGVQALKFLMEQHGLKQTEGLPPFPERIRKSDRVTDARELSSRGFLMSTRSMDYPAVDLLTDGDGKLMARTAGNWFETNYAYRK